MTYDEIVENIARAWASIDGKSTSFDECKANPSLDMTEGYYMGYIVEAKELIERSGIKKHLKLSEETNVK